MLNTSFLDIKICLKKPVFERGDGNWIDVLPTKTKQYKNKIQSTTKLTPKEASFKKNEVKVYKSFLDKREKSKGKFQINDLVSTATLRKNVFNG